MSHCRRLEIKVVRPHSARLSRPTLIGTLSTECNRLHCRFSEYKFHIGKRTLADVERGKIGYTQDRSEVTELSAHGCTDFQCTRLHSVVCLPSWRTGRTILAIDQGESFRSRRNTDNQPEPIRRFGETATLLKCKPASWRAPERELAGRTVCMACRRAPQMVAGLLLFLLGRPATTDIAGLCR